MTEMMINKKASSTPMSASIDSQALAHALAMTWPLADDEDYLDLNGVALSIVGGQLIASATDRMVAGWARCPADGELWTRVSRLDAEMLANQLASECGPVGIAFCGEDSVSFTSATRAWTIPTRHRDIAGRHLGRIAGLLLNPRPWDTKGFAIDLENIAPLLRLPASQPLAVTVVGSAAGCGPLIRVTSGNSFLGCYMGCVLQMDGPKRYWEDIPTPEAWQSLLSAAEATVEWLAVPSQTTHIEPTESAQA